MNESKGNIIKMTNSLTQYIRGISPADGFAIKAAKTRLDNLIKPPGSLGKLEEVAVKLAGITGKTRNNPQKKCVLVMCSDNGVVAEGVAAAPQETTFAMAANFVKGAVSSRFF